jgi:hypothetical protein
LPNLATPKIESIVFVSDLISLRVGKLDDYLKKHNRRAYEIYRKVKQLT